MKTPPISVIMPVYNSSDYLRQAIDSILKQSFSEFEFIIINDGSSDDSQAIIESVSDSRIVFQMGATIAYYTYARQTQSETLETFANYLLDQALSSIAIGLPVCLYNGICGIGCGLIYLLRNRFVEGNEDEVLGEIDHVVLTNLCAKKDIDGYHKDQQDYIAYRREVWK